MNILLHMCCSNCTLYPTRILRSEGHNFTGFWFNPNIHDRKEYDARLSSLKRIAHDWRVDVLYNEDYQPDRFFSLFNISGEDAAVKLLRQEEHEAGGGTGPPPSAPQRCLSCYRLRLEETASVARQQDFEAFTTTLLISPFQDHAEIVRTGTELADAYDVHFLQRDFRPHFRVSQSLAAELGLYRQNYCGCLFSREDRLRKRASRRTKQRS